jgi:sugar phosphate permease
MGQTGTWRTAWLVAAGLCALALIATLFIKNTPADLGQHPDGIEPAEALKAAHLAALGAKGTYKTKEPWVLKEALRTRVVWLLMACTVGQAWALYMVTTHGRLHLTDLGFTAMQAASAIGNLILFSGIARFPTGLLADRVEPRILSSIALFGMALSMLAFWQIPQDMAVLLVVSAAYGFFFGVTTISFPMITANYFGPPAFAPISGFLTPFVIGLGAPLPFVAGVIFDRYDSYDLAFIPIVIMLLLSSILAWLLYPPEKPPPFDG